MSRSRSKRTSKRATRSKGRAQSLSRERAPSVDEPQVAQQSPEATHSAPCPSSPDRRSELSASSTQATAPLWRRAPLTFMIASVFLGVQVWLPMSYYLGDYPWDERFAWRMFSTVRSLNCQAQAWEGAQPGQPSVPCPGGQGRCAQVRLSQALHMVWVNLLKRGRREVVEKLVQTRCAEGAGRPFYMSLTCPHPEAPHPLVTVQAPTQDLCSHPEALLPPLSLTPQGAHK